jgi:hypothetical protein
MLLEKYQTNIKNLQYLLNSYTCFDIKRGQHLGAGEVMAIADSVEAKAVANGDNGFVDEFFYSISDNVLKLSQYDIMWKAIMRDIREVEDSSNRLTSPTAKEELAKKLVKYTIEKAKIVDEVAIINRDLKLLFDTIGCAFNPKNDIGNAVEEKK